MAQKRHHRNLLAVATLVLFAASCSNQDVLRDREVSVMVDVVDGRDASGVEVTATRRGPGDPYTVFVVQVTEETGVSQSSCEEALGDGARMAEALGVPAPTQCVEDERVDRVVTDRFTALTDGSGAASLSLLDGPYSVSAAVEIVPGDDGCHWSGTAEIGADVVDGTVLLSLDSNTCE